MQMCIVQTINQAESNPPVSLSTQHKNSALIGWAQDTEHKTKSQEWQWLASCTVIACNLTMHSIIIIVISSPYICPGLCSEQEFLLQCFPMSPIITPRDKRYFYWHFTDVETEFQQFGMICPVPPISNRTGMELKFSAPHGTPLGTEILDIES